MLQINLIDCGGGINLIIILLLGFFFISSLLGVVISMIAVRYFELFTNFATSKTILQLFGWKGTGFKFLSDTIIIFFIFLLCFNEFLVVVFVLFECLYNGKIVDGFAIGSYFLINFQLFVGQFIGVGIIIFMLSLFLILNLSIRVEILYLLILLALFTSYIFYCGDFVGFLIAFEGISFVLYIYATLQGVFVERGWLVKACESYILFGILASSLGFFGFSLLYSQVGSIYFNEISKIFLTLNVDGSDLWVLAGFFILIGFFFKLSLVPFHSWLISIYKNVEDHVVFFFAIFTKPVFVIILIFKLGFLFENIFLRWLLFCFSVLSIGVGTAGALQINDIKGLIAYSAIANIGITCLIVSYGGVSMFSFSIFYILIYIMSLVIIFLSLFQFGVFKQGNEIFLLLSSYRGCFQVSAHFAINITMGLVGIMGLPPFILFLVKIFLVNFLIENFSINTAVLIVVMSILGMGYYVRIIFNLFFYKFYSIRNDLILKRVGVYGWFGIVTCYFLNGCLLLLNYSFFSILNMIEISSIDSL